MSQEARGISRNLRLPLTIGENLLENRIHKGNKENTSCEIVYVV